MIDNYPVLELDDSYYPSVLQGTTTATIRIGERVNLQPGRFTFKAANAGYLPLMMNADLIIRTTWLGISDHDAQLAGYRDGDHAREDMLQRYPEAKPDTPFSIIRFSRPA